MWFLPTISEALILTEPALESQARNSEDSTQAEREWSAGIAALSQILQQVVQQSSRSNRSNTSVSSSVDSPQGQGLVLAGPCPIIDDATLDTSLQSWIFTAEPFDASSFQLQLPPAGEPDLGKCQDSVRSVSLISKDPLRAERFCLVLTADFSLVMVLGKNLSGQPTFLFSFAPQTVQKAWEVLRLRVLLTRSRHVGHLDTLVHQFAQTEPHYQIVMQFGRSFAKRLSVLPQAAASESTSATVCEDNHSKSERLASEVVGSKTVDSPRRHLSSATQLSGAETRVDDMSWLNVSGRTATEAYGNGRTASTPGMAPNSQRERFSHSKGPLDGFSDLNESFDAKLLQAIAHEVRTPLTTINTLTRLLLKRSDLPSEVMQRLEMIHRECAEQIDRFSLIFRAAELETAKPQQSPVQLTSVSLAQVLQKSVPRWQKQAARRNLNLHVALPQQMPAVVSDPTMLDQVLTGLIDRFARSLTAGSHIYLQVTLAGEQLKLQLRSQPNPPDPGDQVKCSAVPILQSIGQLLMLQPETGSLSLSLPVTKNLFQALGGKLTVKQQSQQGEVLTIFLPLGPDKDANQLG